MAEATTHVLGRHQDQRVRLIDSVSGTVTLVGSRYIHGKGILHMSITAMPSVQIEREESRVPAEPIPLLPRRGDEDLHEITDAPIFLIQRRVIRYHDHIPYEFDGEDFVDPDIDDDRLVDEGYAFVDWVTERVGFTRAESELWAERNKHNGPFRAWSVATIGELRLLLRRLTDYEPPYTGPRP